MTSHMVPFVAEAVSLRVVERLAILVAEQPDLLGRRLARLDPDVLAELLHATSLPPRLSHLERPHERRGVLGTDYRLDRPMVQAAPPAERWVPLAEVERLDDDDLLAAGSYVPETLPGYMLG